MYEKSSQPQPFPEGRELIFSNYQRSSKLEPIKKKILWTFKVIEELDQIPETYLKYIKNSSGLYKIRVQVGNNIFRIFCFFDVGNVVVVGHGFQKKSQKTPKQQIERAEQIKREYYENKK